MKKRITCLEEFNEERRRAKNRIQELEALIENDVHQLKESLQPIKIAGGVLKNFLASEKGGALNGTIGLAIDGLINRFFLRKSNSIFKSIVSLLLRNLVRNLILKNSDNVVEWVKKLLAKIKSDHEGEKEGV